MLLGCYFFIFFCFLACPFFSSGSYDRKFSFGMEGRLLGFLFLLQFFFCIMIMELL